MTRRFKRLRDFDISLQIKSDPFINPPREAQKNWLLNQALSEFANELIHLDAIAKHWVPGAPSFSLHERSHLPLNDADIMEDWQKPLMQAMAEVVTATHGDVLEVGFGLGVSATYIQALGVKSHTIIECNDSVVQRFYAWKRQYPNADIRLIHGTWQDTIGGLDLYDGVFFHTYPLNETEYLEYIVQSTTFAQHFFPVAAAHLRPGGIFTYLTNEIDSFSRTHQRLILRYFSSMTLQVIEPLHLPQDVQDAWWADSMVVIKALK